MLKTKIALVQMNALIGQINLNLQRIANYSTEAAQQGVDVICFPELAITGYSRDKSHLFAEPVPGNSSKFIAKLAQQLNITILAGMVELSPVKNKPYITHLVVFPDGGVHLYRKTHLGSSEKPYFTAGNTVNIFDIGKALFGVQICWDTHFPEMSTLMSLKGAEIIFAPFASPRIAGDRKKMWLKYLTARAYDNAVFLATCNLIGDNGYGQFSGGAMVIDPKGNVLAEDFNNQESMLVVELEVDLINRIRYQEATSMKNLFYLKSRRPELYKDLSCNNLVKNIPVER
jgi:predicted amidohydrolase